MNHNYLDYPFHIDPRGRAATTGEDDHLRDMIEQVLFTNPGERVNLPDFGCGIKQLVFAPNSDTLATVTRFTINQSLQKWLGGLIDVQNVEVAADEARLDIQITYVKLTTLERKTVTIST